MMTRFGMLKLVSTILQTKFFSKVDGYNLYTPEFNHDTRLDSLFSYNKAVDDGNVGIN